MRKLVCSGMAVLTVVSMLAGCSFAGPDKTGDTEGASAKVAVNFEGTVTAVDEGKVTLDDGKIVVISRDTVFKGDPDTDNAVSEEIAVGNFIQGYTREEPDAEQVSADAIYCNEAVRPGGGKIVINYEGMIVSVEGDHVTLESGQVVYMTEDTVFSIPGGIVDHVILSVGDYIQGYTEDDGTAEEITAARIHVVG